MEKEKLSSEKVCALGVADISEEDVLSAMQDMKGYLDVTPGDFKEIYRYAHQHALKRITRSVTAGHVMTREVVSVRHDTPLQDVADIMASKGVSGVPVLDQQGKVAGVISERDFLTEAAAGRVTSWMGLLAMCLKSSGCLAVTLHKKKAEDLMTAPAITVAEPVSITEVVRLFREKAINRLPVLDKHGALIGIISRGDIVGYSFV